MIKEIKTPWCNWPNRKYAREIEDLYKMGVRCDAWRAFLHSEILKKLRKIKGSFIWFHKHDYFDKLICEFDCSEKKLRNVIKSLMREGHEVPVDFVRDDIYDARAWANLPLSCFAKIEGCNERSKKRHWQSDILKHNEVPIVQFGIKLSWVVSRSCFTLTHRLKDDGRYALMTFKHMQQDYRFEGKRWVAEEMFPRNATRKEMTECLFAKVKKECAKHLVTISDS